MAKKKRVDEWEDDLDYTPEDSIQRVWKPWMDGKEFILVRTYEQIEEIVQKGKETGIVALDFEATGLDTCVYPKIKWNDKQYPERDENGELIYLKDEDGNIVYEPYDKVVGVCLACDEQTAYYIPIRHYEDPADEEYNLNQDKVFEILNQLVDAPNVRFVFHNAKFDTEIYATSTMHDPKLYRNIQDINKFEDTQILAYLWETDLARYGLKWLSETLLGMKMIEINELFLDNRSKKNVKFEQLHAQEAYIYGASDAIITMSLYNELMRRLTKEKRLQTGIYKIEKKLMMTLRKMQNNKVTMDVDYYKRMDRYLEIRLGELRKDICGLAGKRYDPEREETYKWIDSTQQLGKYLFEELGLEGGKKTEKAGQWTTQDEDLDRIFRLYQDKSGDEKQDRAVKLLQLIRGYRKFATVKVRYIEPFTKHVDTESRAKFQFKQTVVTGRLKSEGGAWENGHFTGVNVQSIPATYKAIPFRVKRLQNRPFIKEIDCYLLDALNSLKGDYRREVLEKISSLRKVGEISLKDYDTKNPKFTEYLEKARELQEDERFDSKNFFSEFNLSEQELNKKLAKFIIDEKNKKKWDDCCFSGPDLKDSFLFGWLENVYCARASCEGCPFKETCTWDTEFIDANKNAPNSRKGFIAPKDFMIVAIDYSGVELRVAANVSKENSWIEQFTEQKRIEIENLKRELKGKEPLDNPFGDLHSLNAKNIFGPGFTKNDRQVAKCVTGDTYLLTKNGLVRFDTLVKHREEGFQDVKNLVIESKVGKKKATKTYYHPGAEIWRVETDLGLEVKGNKIHKVLVVRNGKTELVEIQNLKENDIMVIKVNTQCHGNKTTLPKINQQKLLRTSAKEITLPEKLDSPFARFLGYFVSEGSISHVKNSYAVQLTMSSEKFKEDMDLVSSKLENNLKLRNVSLTKEGKKNYQYGINSKSFFYLLKELGCFAKSENKIIPDTILQAPKNLKAEFFRALFEGDGISCESGSLSYTSKSDELVRQIQLEMLNWGVVGSFRKDWNKKYQRYYYTWYCNNKLSVQKFMEEIGFISEKKHSRIINAWDSKEEVYERSNLQIEGFNREIKKLLEQQDQYCEENNISKYSNKKPDWMLTGRDRDAFDTRIKRGLGIGSKWFKLLENKVDGEFKEFIENGLYTVKVRKVENLKYEEEIFDVYEPDIRLMVSNGLVTFDTLGFQTLYGGSGRGIARNLRNEGIKISDEEGEEYQKKFFAGTPQLKKWIAQQHKVAKQKQIVETPFGRSRKLPQAIGMKWNSITAKVEDPDDDGMKKRLMSFARRSAVNSPIQGGAADIIKIAMGKIDALIEKRKWENDVRLMLTVHDELVFEVRKSMANEIIPAIVKVMVNIAKKWVAPLKVDCDCGDSWYPEYEFGEKEDEVSFLKYTDFEGEGTELLQKMMDALNYERKTPEPEPIKKEVTEEKVVDEKKLVPELLSQKEEKGDNSPPQEEAKKLENEVIKAGAIEDDAEIEDISHLLKENFEKNNDCYAFVIRGELTRQKAHILRRAIVACQGETPLVVLTEAGVTVIPKEQGIYVNKEKFELLMEHEELL